MEAQRRLSNRKAGYRTKASVIRNDVSGGLRRALEWYQLTARKIWDHTPAWIKRVLDFLRQPLTLLVLGLISIAAFIVLFNYYIALSKEIDSRLNGGQFIDGSVGIFSSPVKIRRGDRFTIEELTGYLNSAGYSEKKSSSGTAADRTYTVEGDSISIWPGRQDFEPGIAPVEIVLGRNGRVRSINDLRTGVGVNSTLIEGEMLASVRDGDRRKKTIIDFSNIPENLRDALVAVEDRRFFDHSGIDWRGILRALWRDLSEGEIVEGGSTITQQLVKNSFLSQDRTLKRKVKEAAMAMILESRLSKEEIFTHYCNDVYLGQQGAYAIHGFAEASHTYFDKSMTDLTLSESAFLAGLVHAPNRYSLNRDRSLAVERRNYVLDSMVETGAISQEEARAAKSDPLEARKPKEKDEFGVNYFIDYTGRFIESGGLSSRERYYITMDPRLQRAAFRAVSKHTERLNKLYSRSSRRGGEPPRLQAALVAVEAHTGEVLAMVGGRDYVESQLNRATDARRQPGSAFKPFVYAAAISSRIATPATMLSDRPQEFSYSGGRRTYKPSNFHKGYSNRDVTLREALTRSLNVPAVELAMRVGLGNIASLAEDCGFENPHAYPSLALGTSEVTPLQLAGAYTAFANGGMALRPIPVRRTAQSDQRLNRTPFNAMAVRVFSPQVAYVMTSLMESVVDNGTAASLRGMGIKGAVAGKTGTSNDGWFAGYTPNVVCVAWVGFDDNTDIRVQASDSALPMWADFMKEALEIRPELGGESFARPGGISTLVIDPRTGFAAGQDCSDRREEIFIAGTEPYSTCTHTSYEDYAYLEDAETDYDEYLPVEDHSRVRLDVCSETGLLASSDCEEVETMSFEIGKEPYRICRGHGRKPDLK
jgi:penicillin-binding protein 1B